MTINSLKSCIIKFLILLIQRDFISLWIYTLTNVPRHTTEFIRKVMVRGRSHRMASNLWHEIELHLKNIQFNAPKKSVTFRRARRRCEQLKPEAPPTTACGSA